MLDICMLPDEDGDAFYEQMAAIINNAAIEIVPDRIYRPVAARSDLDNGMFQIIEAVASRLYRQSTTDPFMSTGAASE